METPRLNIPQHRFITSGFKFNAFVAGMGSGKTFVGAHKMMGHFARFPKVDAAYYAPTHKLVKDVFWPTLDEVGYILGFRMHFRVADKEVHVKRNGKFYGVINCRTLDKPENIVGFKSGYSLIDELDILATEKAKKCWTKILGRMRYKIDGLVNGVDVTTTPEGYKFVYQKFKKAPQDNPSLLDYYNIVHASTYDNEKNLPHDYIDTMLRDYPGQYINAYLNGQFVSLTSGQVYHAYDRANNRSKEVAQTAEAVYIGMDFNVTKMAAAIFIKRDNGFHCVGQITNGFDTPEMIRTIRSKWGGRRIVIYPDASGRNRHASDASRSDISLLEEAGFTVIVNRSNPAVKDRVLSVNSGFASGRLWVNDSLAPDIALSLEQQVYDEGGDPDKKSGHDHTNDAFGYPIVKEMPINKPVSNIKFRIP